MRTHIQLIVSGLFANWLLSLNIRSIWFVGGDDGAPFAGGGHVCGITPVPKNNKVESFIHFFFFSLSHLRSIADDIECTRPLHQRHNMHQRAPHKYLQAPQNTNNPPATKIILLFTSLNPTNQKENNTNFLS